MDLVNYDGHEWRERVIEGRATPGALVCAECGLTTTVSELGALQSRCNVRLAPRSWLPAEAR